MWSARCFRGRLWIGMPIAVRWLNWEKTSIGMWEWNESRIFLRPIAKQRDWIAFLVCETTFQVTWKRCLRNNKRNQKYWRLLELSCSFAYSSLASSQGNSRCSLMKLSADERFSSAKDFIKYSWISKTSQRDCYQWKPTVLPLPPPATVSALFYGYSKL